MASEKVIQRNIFAPAKDAMKKNTVYETSLIFRKVGNWKYL